MSEQTCLCLRQEQALRRLADALHAAHDKGNHVTAGSFPPELTFQTETSPDLRLPTEKEGDE